MKTNQLDKSLICEKSKRQLWRPFLFNISIIKKKLTLQCSVCLHSLIFCLSSGFERPIFKREDLPVNPIRVSGRRDSKCIDQNMTYKPQHIANFFLDKSEQEERPITQMKLHKLIYIAYGWYLALKGERLFEDRIEAWEHGPVIKGIRDEFKNFGRDPISVKSMEFDWDTLEECEPRIPTSDADTQAILERVWESYKNFTAGTLRNKTHEPGTPWYTAYNDGKGYGSEIRDEEIAIYYKERISKYLIAAREFA